MDQVDVNMERKSLSSRKVAAPVNNVQLSTNAVYLSTAINPSDAIHDQLHYHLGMWGKLIILAVIHKHGRNLKVDPEKCPGALNWRSVFRDIIIRTPIKMQHLLSLDACQRWFENRLRIYKSNFPAYREHESAVDQLMRYYSLQLMTLQECSVASKVGWSKFYWENYHEDPAVDSGSADNLIRLSDLLEAFRQTNPTQLQFLSSAFCTVGIKKASSDFLGNVLKEDETVSKLKLEDNQVSGKPSETLSDVNVSMDNNGFDSVNEEVKDVYNNSDAVEKLDAPIPDESDKCSVSTVVSSNAEDISDNEMISNLSQSPGPTVSSTPSVQDKPENSTLATISVNAEDISDNEVISNLSQSPGPTVSSTPSVQDKPENSTLATISINAEDSGHCHVVVEHDNLLPSSPVKSTPQKRKRDDSFEEKPLSVSEDPQIEELANANKRPKLQVQEKLNMKPLLLSVLAKFRDGQGLLYEMSELVTKRAADSGCEYTLVAIEKKILNGEIQDVESIVYYCRCLVMLFMLSEKNREVSKEAFEVLNALRTFNLQDTGLQAIKTSSHP